MKINVFCNLNDHHLHSLSLFKHSNIIPLNIRNINDYAYVDSSVILLSNHSTNQRMIRYIRRFNVLTPIYLVSKQPIFLKEINGCLHPNELSFNFLLRLLNLFPQQYIWNYAFSIDKEKRLFQPLTSL